MGFSAKTMYSAVPFETALSLTGFGRYQIGLVAICSLIYLSCGFQNGLNAYVMLAAQCDLKMTSQDKGLLNVVFIAGGISSAYIWGLFADHLGRKKVLVLSLALDSVVTFASSFSQNFEEFAVFRFLNGFLIGCPASLICTYLGEFISEQYRAVCLCTTGLFWTVSWLLLPALAMVILPLTWEFQFNGFLYNSWRLYVAIFSAPSAISALFLCLFFPESPKFLYTVGNDKEALSIMSKMFSVNFREAWTKYPVESVVSTEPSDIYINCRESNKSILDVIKNMFNTTLLLFKPPILGATLLASCLQFSNMFGYYGLGLWLPELSDRFEEHYRESNSSVTVCELQTYKNSSISEFSDCDNNSLDVESKAFFNTFIIGTSCLVGNILCSLLAKFVGLKMLTVVTMGVSGFCALAIYYITSPEQNLIMSCIFLAFISVANTVITSVICDLFPTRVRGLASCSSLFVGRIGSVTSNLVLGFLLDFSCEIPIFVISGVIFGGSLVALFIPRKTTKL